MRGKGREVKKLMISSICRAVKIFSIPNLLPRQIDEVIAIARSCGVLTSALVDSSMGGFARYWNGGTHMRREEVH